MAGQNGSLKTALAVIGIAFLACILFTLLMFATGNFVSALVMDQDRQIHPQITQFHDHRL